MVISHFDDTVGSGKVTLQLTNAKVKSSAGAFITVSGTWTGVDLIGDTPACHN